MTQRLRPSVHCLMVDEGVLFRVWDDQFVIKGPPSMSKLCAALMNALQRGISVEQLRQTLPPSAVDIALHIVDELSRRGGLLNTASLSVPALADDLRERYRGTVSLLESRVGDPYATFLAFRRARVLVAGTGDALAAALAALARMGLERVNCACPADERESVCTGLAGDRDYIVVDFVEDEGDTHHFDLRIRIDTLSTLDAIDASRRFDTRPPGSQIEAILTPTIGLVTPVSGDASGLSMADVVARLRPESLERVGDPPGYAFGSPVVASLVGNLVAFEALKHLCGIADHSTLGKAAVIVPSSLECHWHPIEPMAAWRREEGADDVIESVRRFQDAEPSTLDQFLERIAALTDRHFGWFDDPHPRHLPQIPVALAVTRAADQTALSAVIGAGQDEDAARHQAVVELVRWTAAEAADPETAAAVDLVTGEVTEVLQSAMQLAAGHTYSEWVLDGLHRLAAAEAADALNGWFRLKTHGLRFEDVLDTEARWLWKSLALRFGRSIEVVRSKALACPFVHVSHIVERGTTLALGTGISSAEALRAALLTALARAQLERAGEGAANLPVFRRWRQATSDFPAVTPDMLEPPDVSVCIRSLEREGAVIVAAPYDREPALRRHGLLLGWMGLHGRK